VTISAESPGDLILAAALNNASLCDSVCRAHGISPHFGDDAWTSVRRTPPLYPDAVTLKPGISVESVLARVDSSAGCSIKDSFATLALTTYGFTTLLEAQWIVRHSGEPRPPSRSVPGVTWRILSEPLDLALWEAAWRQEGVPPTFLPRVLDDGLVFLAAFDGDFIASGAIVHRSNGVVGVSNVFAKSTSRSEMWPGCLEAISHRFPDLPIIGYESGAALRDAVDQGFRPLGALRVWLRGDK
jgi:hypothetical protein